MTRLLLPLACALLVLATFAPMAAAGPLVCPAKNPDDGGCLVGAGIYTVSYPHATASVCLFVSLDPPVPGLFTYFVHCTPAEPIICLGSCNLVTP